MKKFSVLLSEEEIMHILGALDLMCEDVEYGGKAYRDYCKLEASITKAFKKARYQMTAEDLKDIRRTLNKL